MKYLREKYSALDGFTKVKYTVEGNDSFKVEASQMGVTLSGTVLFQEDTDLEPFAKALSEAWVDYRKLRPKLARTITGH